MTDVGGSSRGVQQRYRISAHRWLLLIIGTLIIVEMAVNMRWDWIPQYIDLAMKGLWTTTWMLVAASVLSFVFAVPLGLAQVSGIIWLSVPARMFCTSIRGTPLLLQLWLLYYGLGSLFPQFPWVRQSELWPYLRQAWPYGLLALTLSGAGYEGEVMRGAFENVSKGQLEAARSYGMPYWTAFRRIWLPQAIYKALPTLAGETVLLLKSTPLVATISVIDIFAVASRVRQETYITYEPLLLIAAIYVAITGVIVLLFRFLERRIPARPL